MKLGASYADHGFVFTSSTGNPLDPMRARTFMVRVLRKAGLPLSVRLYDLRHSCATLLLAAGENPKIVSERLGHTSVKMTLDVYSHVLPTMQQGAAEKLEKACFGEVGTL